MFQLSLATNFPARRDTAIIAVAILAASFASWSCNQRDAGSTEESPHSLTSQILSLDREQAAERPTSEQQVATPETAPGTRIVRGKVIARQSGRAEVNCRISFGGAVTHSDNTGAFTLPNVPAGEEARVRFSCRGHIERRSIRIPEGEGTYELRDPISIGPQQADPSRGPSNHTESVGIEEAIRQMDQERAENEGNASIFGKAGRGLANFAGTAAAIATGTDDDESGRYRVLGQWKRAELSAEEAEENEELAEEDEGRDSDDSNGDESQSPSEAQGEQE